MAQQKHYIENSLVSWEDDRDIFSCQAWIVCASTTHGGGELTEKFGGGVQPTSQNPYPIYDRSLQFSLLSL